MFKLLVLFAILAVVAAKPTLLGAAIAYNALAYPYGYPLAYGRYAYPAGYLPPYGLPAGYAPYPYVN